MSGKAEQVLHLEPRNELRFKGPFTDVVTSHLKLTNPTDKRVCFKVKTTAPKRYCVRPNNGIVEPNSTTTIAVMLQPFDVENPNEKNKHKFMVQTMFAPDGDVNQDTLWKEVNPEAIMDSKLKCVFDLPSGDFGTQLNVSASSTASANTALIGSTQVSSSNNVNNEKYGGESTNAKSENSEGITVASSPSNLKTNANISSTNVSPKVSSSGLCATNEDFRRLNEENKKLREEVSSLRHENMQLKEEGLKHRIRGGISSATDPASLHTSLSTKVSDDQMGLLQNPQLIGIAVIVFLFGLIIGKVVF